MALKHFNHKYSGGSPDIPLNIGDSYFAQDMARDFWFLRDQIGKSVLDLANYPFLPILLRQVDFNFQSSGHINIGSGIGYVQHPGVKVPGSPWTVPPSVNTEYPIVRLSWGFIYDSIDWTGSPTLDGTTINYVKLRYKETDGATRTRTKKGGSYSYEIEPSYEVVINSSYPTNADLAVAAFKGTALTDAATTRYQANVYSFGHFNNLVTGDCIITRPGKYLIKTAQAIVDIQPSSFEMPEGSCIDVMSLFGCTVKNNVTMHKYLNCRVGNTIDLSPGDSVRFVKGPTDRWGGDPFFDVESNPAFMPTSTVTGGKWSPDNRYLAITWSGGTAGERLTIYDTDGGVFTKLSNPVTPPEGLPRSVDWSPDGKYVACTLSVTPYIAIFDMTSGVPVRVSDVTGLPAGNTAQIAFSPNGKYAAVAHSTTPFVSIYDLSSGPPWSKMANPATLPASTGQSVTWSPDGRYLAVGHDLTPFVTVYDMSSGAPLKIANPGTVPAGTVYGVAFSPDGRYLACEHSTSPFITIYDMITDVLVKIPNPDVLPPAGGAGGNVSFSPDGRYMSVGHPTTSPYWVIYDMLTGTPFKLPAPGSFTPPGTVRWIQYTSDGKYVAAGFEASGWLKILKAQSVDNILDIVVLESLNKKRLINSIRMV